VPCERATLNEPLNITSATATDIAKRMLNDASLKERVRKPEVDGD
jgi:hypothetical protein